MAQIESSPIGTEPPARPPAGMDAIKIESDGDSLPLRGAGRREVPLDLNHGLGGKAATLPATFWLVGWGLVIVVFAGFFWNMGTGDGVSNDGFPHRG